MCVYIYTEICIILQRDRERYIDISKQGYIDIGYMRALHVCAQTDKQNLTNMFIAVSKTSDTQMLHFHINKKTQKSQDIHVNMNTSRWFHPSFPSLARKLLVLPPSHCHSEGRCHWTVFTHSWHHWAVFTHSWHHRRSERRDRGDTGCTAH